LGYCLQFLQEYEASAIHYKKSIPKMSERRKSQNLDVNVYDQSNSIEQDSMTDKQVITEE